MTLELLNQNQTIASDFLTMQLEPARTDNSGKDNLSDLNVLLLLNRYQSDFIWR